MTVARQELEQRIVSRSDAIPTLIGAVRLGKFSELTGKYIHSLVVHQHDFVPVGHFFHGGVVTHSAVVTVNHSISNRRLFKPIYVGNRYWGSTSSCTTRAFKQNDGAKGHQRLPRKRLSRERHTTLAEFSDVLKRWYADARISIRWSQAKSWPPLIPATG